MAFPSLAGIWEQVSPRLAASDASYGVSVNAILLRQSSDHAFMWGCGSDSYNVGIGELGVAVALASCSGKVRAQEVGVPLGIQASAIAVANCAATFCDHISTIVCGRAKEKMTGVNTQRRITSMADIQTLWNWAIGKLPCKTMGESVVAPAISKMPIVPASATCPNPTCLGLVNVSPKAFCDGLPPGYTGAFWTATPATSPQLIWPKRKRGLAYRANSGGYRARITAHQEVSFLGAMPRGVTAPPWLSRAQIIAQEGSNV